MVMSRRRMHQKDAIILAGLLGGVLLLLFSPLWGPMIWRAPASFSEPVAVSGQATKKEEKKAIKMLKKLYTYYIENPDEMSAEYRQLMKKGESRLFKRVLKGMLPKNKLGAQLLRNVYIYGGSEHPHAAQTPKTIDINTLK